MPCWTVAAVSGLRVAAGYTCLTPHSHAFIVMTDPWFAACRVPALPYVTVALPQPAAFNADKRLVRWLTACSATLRVLVNLLRIGTQRYIYALD